MRLKGEHSYNVAILGLPEASSSAIFVILDVLVAVGGHWESMHGRAPVEHVQTLRIEEAKQLLETTDMSLEDVAAEVGYSEASSFRHVFRRLVGMTASAYRRRRLPSLEAFERG